MNSTFPRLASWSSSPRRTAAKAGARRPPAGQPSDGWLYVVGVGTRRGTGRRRAERLARWRGHALIPGCLRGASGHAERASSRQADPPDTSSWTGGPFHPSGRRAMKYVVISRLAPGVENARKVLQVFLKAGLPEGTEAAYAATDGKTFITI